MYMHKNIFDYNKLQTTANWPTRLIKLAIYLAINKS